MEIEYHGANCVVIKNKKTNIVVDPTTSVSVKENKNVDSVIILTKDNPNLKAKAAFVIDMPGEYEHNDVSVKGIAVHLHTDEAGKHSTMYRVEIDGVRIAIIGHTDAPLDDDDLENLGVIDVVIVPVGGNGYTLDARDAAAIVQQISPKAVIPTHFADHHVKYEVPQEPIDEFIKIMSAAHEKASALKVKGVGGLPEALTIYEINRTA